MHLFHTWSVSPSINVWIAVSSYLLLLQLGVVDNVVRLRRDLVRVSGSLVLLVMLRVLVTLVHIDCFVFKLMFQC